MNPITYTPDNGTSETFYACGLCGNIYTSLTYRLPVDGDPRASAEKCCTCSKCGKDASLLNSGPVPKGRQKKKPDLSWCPYFSGYLCPECHKESKQANYQQQRDEALKNRLAKVERTIPYGAEGTRYVMLWDDDRYRDQDDLEDYFYEIISEHDCDLPPYVFATHEGCIEIDLDQVLEDTIERAEVEDPDEFRFANVDKLRAFIDEWNSENRIAVWYEDPKTLVDVSEIWESARKAVEAERVREHLDRCNLNEEDKALLAVFGVEDLPWRIVGHTPIKDFTTFTLSFPGARINAGISDCGRFFSMGIHRDPDSTFSGPRMSDSEIGIGWLNEARRSLGLPERGIKS